VFANAYRPLQSPSLAVDSRTPPAMLGASWASDKPSQLRATALRQIALIGLEIN
jgi:hypothetical protein